MKKIRQIVKRGHSIYIKLVPSDLIDMGWQLGDNLDITDCIDVSREKKK